jgi:hypothetical protein
MCDLHLNGLSKFSTLPRIQFQYYAKYTENNIKRTLEMFYICDIDINCSTCAAIDLIDKTSVVANKIVRHVKSGCVGNVFHYLKPIKRLGGDAILYGESFIIQSHKFDSNYKIIEKTADHYNQLNRHLYNLILDIQQDYYVMCRPMYGVYRHIGQIPITSITSERSEYTIEVTSQDLVLYANVSDSEKTKSHYEMINKIKAGKVVPIIAENSQQPMLEKDKLYNQTREYTRLTSDKESISSRYMRRRSRTPEKKRRHSRSISSERDSNRSRSRSKSPEKKHSRYRTSEKKRHRSRTPEKKHRRSRSPSRSLSRSPERKHRSRASEKKSHRYKSPEKKRSVSPEKKRSVSPISESPSTKSSVQIKLYNRDKDITAILAKRRERFTSSQKQMLSSQEPIQNKSSDLIAEVKHKYLELKAILDRCQRDIESLNYVPMTHQNDEEEIIDLNEE